MQIERRRCGWFSEVVFGGWFLRKSFNRSCKLKMQEPAGTSSFELGKYLGKYLLVNTNFLLV